MKNLKYFLLINDIGFILYWLVTFLHIIPEAYLFKDYNDAIMVAWNWSFFPLDMCVSISGIASVILYNRKNPLWSEVALISLVLTFCSGLLAISFWFIRRDFDLIWWISNLYFLIYPFFFFGKVMKRNVREVQA